MFTGIVEELGEVVGVTRTAQDSALVTVRGPLVASDARHGDSIAVNGVCLTVVDLDGGVFTADIMGETLRRSALGALRAGDRVNLERAATLGSRLGGHLVQGHVDGVGEVLSRDPAQRWETVRFRLPAALSRYVVEKGSITVDGVSLTVAEVGTDWFAVGLIPTTLSSTTLGARSVGDPVNLETDVLAKYVERLLGARTAGGAGPPVDLPGVATPGPVLS
ncbi:riboflavin synthase [Micromonospora sp. Llam7]|uniref:riboflavin synthase n=1 Tax=Micromonospora tarapacensis TaxID=2835305 RepID=UPI001C836B99|nr:riboflavin synthase [Micromonospora tarapacensis]MBX7267871.1 riboflavin synthase [Micromonospora tarapacensis]